MHEFHGLHKELVPYVPWVKTMELPAASKSIFTRSSSKAAFERTRVSIQRYIDSILQDEHLNQSEIIYAFLSPSPSHLKTFKASPRARSNFASFTNFFNKKQGAIEDAGAKKDDSLNEEESWLDEFDSSANMRGADDTAKDTVAESLYALIGEVFNMRGVFKWMRKSLMTFVQITYGSTINRQIRDTVAWLTSEQMLLQYLHSFKKSFWPTNDKAKNGSGGGGVAGAEAAMTAERRATVRAETKEALVQNLPEVLVNLVGQQAAVNGTSRVFETLQNVTLNKQIFYGVLELIMFELFPELAQSQAAQQIKSFSL